MVVSCVVALQVVCFGIGWSGWIDGALLAMEEGRSVAVERFRLELQVLLLLTSVSAWRSTGREFADVVDE